MAFWSGFSLGFLAGFWFLLVLILGVGGGGDR